MNFFIAEFSKFALFWLLSYGLGNWVFYKNIKVNYTRKFIILVYCLYLCFFPFTTRMIVLACWDWWPPFLLFGTYAHIYLEKECHLLKGAS